MFGGVFSQPLYEFFGDFVWSLKRVLPYPMNPPTSCYESISNCFISGLVPGDLWFPITLIRLWHPTMPGAAMPETAIYEHSKTLPAENKIWPSNKRLTPPPTCNGTCPEYSCKKQLCAPIAG